MKGVRYFVCMLGCFFIFVLTIFLAEGMHGFIPFLNLESFLIVVIGTLLVILSTFSWREIGTSLRCALSRKFEPTVEQLDRAKQVFTSLANTTIAFGVIGSILGLILMLSTITDVELIPRRLALSLTALVFGFLLSEVVFIPLKRNVEKRGTELAKPISDERGRVLLGALCLFVILTSCFTVLYALSAALSRNDFQQYPITEIIQEKK